MNLGTLSYFAGRWTEAAEWYRTAREVAMEVGKDFGAAETGVNLAELPINQGRVDAAEAAARRCPARPACLGCCAVHRPG